MKAKSGKVIICLFMPTHMGRHGARLVFLKGVEECIGGTSEAKARIEATPGTAALEALRHPKSEFFRSLLEGAIPIRDRNC
jgi:hypothetical protein